MTQGVNNNLVLIVGKSGTGKTASLRNMKDPRGVIYLGCESGKEIPFPAKFRQTVITDPRQVPAIIEQAEEHDNVHTIVIDTITFLMDMFESNLVLKSKNKMEGWSNYAQYWKGLMQQSVAKSSKNIIMMAHTMDILNEAEGVMETLVKVKGSLMNQGIEAYFCNVIACKKVAMGVLDGYQSDLLNVTEEEAALGFKYVYQTKLTKETVHERLRGPLGLWTTAETFIDNDAQLVLDRLHEYYDEESLMALMLRKACQDTLTEHDLDTFHADIDDNTKYLTLFTPCGKTFALVHGVRFGSTRPSAAEIDYAVELLDDWLRRNAKIIADYLVAFESVQRLKSIKPDGPLIEGWQFQQIVKNEHRPDPYTGNYGYHSIIQGYTVESHEETFVFNLKHGLTKWEGKKARPSDDESTKFSRTVNTKLNIPSSALLEAQERCENLLTFQKAEALMGSIHATLNSCKD
jgi:hypothetical protein